MRNTECLTGGEKTGNYFPKKKSEKKSEKSFFQTKINKRSNAKWKKMVMYIMNLSRCYIYSKNILIVSLVVNLDVTYITRTF